MNRQAFIARLRDGLVGLPQATIAEIVADYEAHFDDGAAAGRSEADVAEALGDPTRLARELRAQAGPPARQEEPAGAGAASAVVEIVALLALDLLIVLPVLMALGGVLFGLTLASIAGVFAGGALLAAGPFTDFPGGPAAAILAGLGVIAGAVALGAVIALAVVGAFKGLIWYGRLHYRLLKPALGPGSQGAAA